MLKIILTIVLLTSCVSKNGAIFVFHSGQPKYLDCLERMDFDRKLKLSLAIDLEFKATATGTHTVRWQEDLDTSERYRIIAESATRLFLQLTACQRVRNIVTEATMATMCANSTLEETPKLFFEEIDWLLRNDALVGLEYQRTKSNVENEGGTSNVGRFENAQNRSRFLVDAVDLRSLNFMIFKQNSFGKMIVLHEYFFHVYDSSKYIRRFDVPDQDDYWTSLATVELSGDPECGDTVQRIYNETVAEAAKTLNGMIRENATQIHDYLPGISEKSLSSVLFDRLKANIRKHSDVAVKFDSMKKKIQFAETRIKEFSGYLDLDRSHLSVIGTALLYEMAASSVGAHFFHTDEDVIVDERSHVIGESVLRLLVRFSTFDRVRELLTDFANAAIYAPLYAQKVDRLFENDPALGQRYKEIKRDVEKKTKIIAAVPDHFDKAKIPLSIFRNETEKSPALYSLLKRNWLAKMAFLNLLFLDEWKEFGLTATNGEKNATVNAIVQLSKNSKYADRVERLYDEAISLVTKNLDILMRDRDPSQMEKITSAVSDVLFKSLAITFQKDANMAAEFEITKMICEAGAKTGGK